MRSKTIVIFGGTGDLSYRKLFPALYDLNKLGKIDDDFKIIGIGRREYTKQDYVENIQKWTKEFSRLSYEKECFEDLAKKIYYYKMDFQNVENYKELSKYFEKLELREETIYYYAVSPEFFTNITVGLSHINEKHTKAKIIVEKPFGKDLETARDLNKMFLKYFDYENIYYIDHYLGKEMLLNIMSIRFFNTMFNGIWNKEFVDNVQINVMETVGVETRGGYYDKSGAIADMMQNHLFQILSIVAMDEPQSFETQDIKKEQSKIFTSLRKIVPEKIDDSLVLGQYKGYKKEDKVDENSTTETFSALKLYVDNERWEGVPFYLRTGKKLKNREIQIILQFKPNPNAFKLISSGYVEADLQKVSTSNYLVIKIQPTEGISLRFNIKKPGTVDELELADLDYCQSCMQESIINTPQAYERLLEAAMDDRKNLFSSWEQIQESWEYMNAVIDSYKKHSNKLYEYEQGSLGPKEADDMIAKDGRSWI